MTGAPVRGVTVDLDDTLFPQERWLAGAWRAVAARGGLLGLPEDELLAALHRAAAAGSDRGGIIDRALAELGGPAGHVPDLVDAFAGHAPSRLAPYPGVVDALSALAARAPVVCVTDGNPRIQHAKLDALGVRGLLQAVVVSDELVADGAAGRALRKPHPAPFRRALDLLGLPAGQVVHVGDRPAKDVAGALAVGIHPVRVLTGEYAAEPDGPHRPWRTVGSFAAATGLLLSLLPAAREHRGASVGL